MTTSKLIAAAAAVALTLASLGAINYNVPSQPGVSGDAIQVVNLAPVYVHPSAAELRATASRVAGVALSTQSRHAPRRAMPTSRSIES